MESTAATPMSAVSVAHEHDGRKLWPHVSKLNVRKESIYRFNNSSDDKSSSKYSIWDEERLGDCLGEYSLVKETGIDSLQMNIHNSFGNRFEVGLKSSSSETLNDSLSFEEINYNSASNHMKEFQKYSTKKKNQIANEGSSGGLFNYHIMPRVNLHKNMRDEPPSPESYETESVSLDNMSMGSSSNQSQVENLLRKASITSLPVDRSAQVDKIPRWTSLVSLIEKHVPSEKERFLLNQYLYSIKEESDDNFKKYKEKNQNRKLTQVEDIICEEEEVDKKVPKSLMSASRHDTNTSMESSVIINMPNRTKSRNREYSDNTLWSSFVYQPMRSRGGFSRNQIDRSNPVFRTFEGSVPHDM